LDSPVKKITYGRQKKKGLKLFFFKFKKKKKKKKFLTMFCSSLDGIWTHTIDTLQHQSLSLMSSALDHSATSAIYIYIDSNCILYKYLVYLISKPRSIIVMFYCHIFIYKIINTMYMYFVDRS
jgi:hypothetical protein